MDFTKFVSILENRALFFARADKLGDPFEGSVPKKNIDLLSDEERAMYAPVMQQLPRFTLISCWHESTHESEAMWKLYSSTQGGIAIKTRFESFVNSFRIDERLHIGRVQYLDYDSDQIPEVDPLSPYLHKRRSFEHEREVRAIIQYLPTGLNRIESGLNIWNISEDEIATWQDIRAFGDYYEVDLNLLIQEIVVDPFAPEWLLDLVNLVAERYELDAPINKSRLAESPMW